MAFLEPFTIPGLDKALLELLIIVSLILIAGVTVTVGSIIGLIRAIRRRRRGGRSLAAVLLSATATALALAWLFYWVLYDLHDKANLINALLGINTALCLLPLSWLIAAIRANRTQSRNAIVKGGTS